MKINIFDHSNITWGILSLRSVLWLLYVKVCLQLIGLSLTILWTLSINQKAGHESYHHPSGEQHEIGLRFKTTKKILYVLLVMNFMRNSMLLLTQHWNTHQKKPPENRKIQQKKAHTVSNAHTANDVSSRSVTDGSTDRRTDGPTDQRTDRPSQRDARTHLKRAKRRKKQIYLI